MNESDLERRVADVLRKRSEDAMRAVDVEEDLDTLRRRAKREVRSHRTLGIAAVLVALVAGAALLLPERGSSAPDSADAAAPSASTDATPTAAPGPGDSWGWRPPVSSSGTVQGFFSGVDPRVDFSYTLPDGWWPVDMGTVRAPNAWVSLGAVANVYVDGCRWTLLDPPLGPDVDDLAAVWGELPGFTATTPVDITVDGYTGKRVDFTVPDYDQTQCRADMFVLTTGTATPGPKPSVAPDNPGAVHFPGQQNRLWILDVDGTRLVIHESPDPGNTPEQLAHMDQFIASLRIG